MAAKADWGGLRRKPWTLPRALGSAAAGIFYWFWLSALASVAASIGGLPIATLCGAALLVVVVPIASAVHAPTARVCAVLGSAPCLVWALGLLGGAMHPWDRDAVVAGAIAVVPASLVVRAALMRMPMPSL